MIKGVNKKIIEVNDPDSLYFEKAVFYLRPHIRELPEEMTREEIEGYISRIGLCPNKTGYSRKIRLAAGAAVLTAAAVLTVILILKAIF